MALIIRHENGTGELILGERRYPLALVVKGAPVPKMRKARGGNPRPEAKQPICVQSTTTVDGASTEEGHNGA